MALLSTDFPAAIALMESCLTLSRQAGNARDIAEAMRLLAAVHRQRGEYMAAAKLFEESLVWCREEGGLYQLACALQSYGISER